MKLIPFILLAFVGCKEATTQTGNVTKQPNTFGTFSNQYLKIITTRCIDWEMGDSVGGYSRNVTFEFIITPDKLVIDTVIYEGNKFALWSEGGLRNAMNDGDSCDIITFWGTRYYENSKDPIPHSANYDYTRYIALWIRGGEVHHISIGGPSLIRNKHTIYLY